MSDHVRIWLEPEPGSDPDCGRMWAQNDVWGDGTEYVLAETVDKKIDALKARVAVLEEALQFYKELVRDCRKLTPDGQEARSWLDADGGEKARRALETKP